MQKETELSRPVLGYPFDGTLISDLPLSFKLEGKPVGEYTIMVMEDAAHCLGILQLDEVVKFMEFVVAYAEKYHSEND